MAWILDAATYGPDGHKDLKLYQPSWADRRNARQHLHLIDGSASLFQLERARRDDEHSEPEDLP